MTVEDRLLHFVAGQRLFRVSVTADRARTKNLQNWDGYRAAMVADRRLVVRLAPEHTYEQVRA